MRRLVKDGQLLGRRQEGLLRVELIGLVVCLLIGLIHLRKFGQRRNKLLGLGDVDGEQLCGLQREGTRATCGRGLALLPEQRRLPKPGRLGVRGNCASSLLCVAQAAPSAGGRLRKMPTVPRATIYIFSAISPCWKTGRAAA